MVEIELKPCPFCGGTAEMEPWHGGAPTKQLVGCVGVDDHKGGRYCEVRPSVTGETPSEAIANWNTRTPEQAHV